MGGSFHPSLKTVPFSAESRLSSSDFPVQLDIRASFPFFMCE
uniref:Uncharacterized protein n=1 Tax=Utricularia reniformis TaxID=192314 RepID=A0A1Y0B208_9LAMI|nr:hypothetical protein AEK19_MT1281 [Utricularia reniformis]ART31485.1 hypothetical protein AEK19_MT1281 [Utricularia reniformis]